MTSPSIVCFWTIGCRASTTGQTRWSLTTGGSEAWNGTSMATPHAAGLAALYKDTHGDASSATVHDWFVNNATPNAITGGTVGGTANGLLFSNGL